MFCLIIHADFTQVQKTPVYICPKLIHNLNLLYEATIFFSSGLGYSTLRHCATDGNYD